MKSQKLIKLMSIGYLNKTIQHNFLDQILAETSKTIDPSLHGQIQDKYKTFTNFNYRETYRDRKISRKRKQAELKTNQNTLGDVLATFMLGSLVEQPDQKKKSKKVVVAQQLPGVKSQRRERFKKTNNTFHIIKHYMEKENFKPTEEEMLLMQQLAQVKQTSQQGSLQNTLKKLYKLMNEAVDFNQLKLLCLIVVLAADVCYQHKDYNRAFYFYNQAKLFASYSDFYYIKTESLIAMGNICMDLKFFDYAILIFKKALQYAWKIKSIQRQLLIYDHLGSAYYYEGILKQAQYYHRRFTQGEYERHDSAIKKISSEMLNEIEVYLSSLEKKNITSLFIEYINIPIVGLETVSKSNKVKKAYDNYDEGLSPRRKKKNHKLMQYADFPLVEKQIQKLINEDYQFKTQIPNPDVQRIFVPEPKFGKARKTIAFEQTTQYHKIMGHKEKKVDLSKIQCKSMQKRIEEALSERQDKDWWKRIKDKIKMNQLLKVGQMRDRVFNAHLSLNKYPEERRRANSLKSERIKQSFNKSLLDWIDPPK